MSFPDGKFNTLAEFKNSYSKILHESLTEIDDASMKSCFDMLLSGINSGVNLLSCGNGGSSSIAEHLVCDFIKQASSGSTIKPKVIPLLTTPVITAIANDISYDDIFSFQVERYANSDDILISVSSSGDSQNIINAINTAKNLGVKTISFVGFDGGRANQISDVSLHIKAYNYGIVEDAHHALMHIFSQYLRLENFEDTKNISNTKF
ncbi:MAG: phosphoheptose isomerase [Candidatus Marinimicrobia bacterium]|nr:phosphoheptose isomerase [Candidatus Neomarinimicrobiota bacterium]|tara:strand:+ start:6363 stop:6983 length:621 start_codon:yes stop_codon:yes gene_type:complete